MKKIKTNLIPMNEALGFFDTKIQNLQLNGRLPATSEEFNLQAMRVIDLLRSRNAGRVHTTGVSDVILRDPAVLNRIEELCAQVMGTATNHVPTQVGRDLMANLVRNSILDFGSLDANINTTLIFNTVTSRSFDLDINNRLYTSLSGLEFNRVRGWFTPNNPPAPQGNAHGPSTPPPPPPAPQGNAHGPLTPPPAPQGNAHNPVGPTNLGAGRPLAEQSDNLWSKITFTYKNIISQPLSKFGKAISKHPGKTILLVGAAAYGSSKIYNMMQNQATSTFNGIVELLRVNLKELEGIKNDTASSSKTTALLNTLIRIEINFLKAAENCQKMIKTENANTDAIITSFYSAIAPIVNGRNNLINSKESGLNLSNSRDARIRVIIISEDAALQAQFKKYQVVAKQAEQLVVDKIADPTKPNAPIATGDVKIDDAAKKAEIVRQKAEEELAKKNNGKTFWSYLTAPGAPRTVMFVLGGAALTYGLWKLGQKIKDRYQEWKLKREEEKEPEKQGEETPTPTTQNPYTF